MKILPINNIQTNRQQNFKAKFSAADIDNVLVELKEHDVGLYPKLYTLLERTNELPGKVAKFVSSDEYGNFWQVHIDNKSLSKNKTFINRYAALYESLVYLPYSIIRSSDIVRMPESIFEQKWWENRFKTKEDIKNFNITVQTGAKKWK